MAKHGDITKKGWMIHIKSNNYWGEDKPKMTGTYIHTHIHSTVYLNILRN